LLTDVTLGLPLSTLFAFLLVLARVGGFVTFLPVPGFRAVPDSIKIGLALVITFALFPVWPILPEVVPSIGQLVAWSFCEAGFGLVVGLAVSFLMEGFQIAMQVAAVNAGYGFATTIDPTSQADSGVLQTIASLFCGILFFSAGMDHQLIRLLAASFVRFPAGSWAPSAASLDGIVRLGSDMFSIGLRVALPVVALLILIDFALALVGRVQQHLQLLALAFPAKMAAALALLAAMAPLIPKMFGAAAQHTLAMLWKALS
jgi:flagellar biosynthetic protein FliR